MACNLNLSNPSCFDFVLKKKKKHLNYLYLYPLKASSSSAARLKASSSSSEESNDAEFTPNGGGGGGSSARVQLDLLDQLSSSSSTQGYESDDGPSWKPTIRAQLAQLVGDRDDAHFIIPLGKNLKKVSPNFLTTSQKRNIKRQTYLTEVSRRNDSVFFATIGAFVLLPPLFILGIAIATGYVQLLP